MTIFKYFSFFCILYLYIYIYCIIFNCAWLRIRKLMRFVKRFRSLCFLFLFYIIIIIISFAESVWRKILLSVVRTAITTQKGTWYKMKSRRERDCSWVADGKGRDADSSHVNYTSSSSPVCSWFVWREGRETEHGVLDT